MEQLTVTKENKRYFRTNKQRMILYIQITKNLMFFKEYKTDASNYTNVWVSKRRCGTQ